MSVIAKQLVINKINLPKEILDNVKDYCFYNIEEVTKQNKLKLSRAIVSAECSRANRFRDERNYSDNDEVWAFGACDENIQLQAANCSKCGNYLTNCLINNITYGNIINNLFCICRGRLEDEEWYYNNWWPQALRNEGYNTDDLYSDDDE